MHIDSCYTKDMYMKVIFASSLYFLLFFVIFCLLNTYAFLSCSTQLYNCTLEPIVGPEFWQPTDEPRPLPPLMRIAAGRPKKKRSTRNDIPQDPTKLSKVGTIMNCTYCKAQGHNARTCAAKVMIFFSSFLIFIFLIPSCNCFYMSKM